MANHGFGGSRSHSDSYYFERCHADVREALRNSAFAWSSCWALTMQKKKGIKVVVARLKRADREAAKHIGGSMSASGSLRLPPLWTNSLDDGSDKR